MVGMLKSKTFLLTLIISTLLISNVEAKKIFDNEGNKIQLNQISINSQSPQYSNKTEESINISDNGYYDSSEESFDNMWVSLWQPFSWNALDLLFT